MATTYGYARVSTQDQCLDRQLDALKAAGVLEKDIFTEKMSGTKKDRPQLLTLKDTVQAEDTVLVEALNRLGRSSVDLIDTMQFFDAKGVKLRSLKEEMDFSSATGKMLASLFAILAEFERNCIVERVREGVAAAKKRGRVGGRPKIPQKRLDRAFEMYDAHEFSIPDICRLCDIGKSTFQRYLKRRKEAEEEKSIDLDVD